eukprot:TRINITY_DN10805_c0_g1_i1.p1 TRINITY_DN10805_c0_g1~~TRINITY_DN10805_c0_g1_i1.p1  ORF type:complete len:139 (-),score=15.93 TRINITY_DN10805_c0_g1_i1:43-459(-)
MGLAQAFITYLNLYWSLGLVALLWGTSNPLMKVGGEGVTSKVHKTNSAVGNFFREWIYLLSRPVYLMAFVMNLTGSVLFYYSLSHAEISMITTITNSLTFLTTSLMGRVMGEKANFYTYTGMFLVLLGVTLCMWSKPA